MTDECGYYLSNYNFAVRMHNGQWCQFARQPADKPASTAEQIRAVEEWAALNRRKYDG